MRRILVIQSFWGKRSNRFLMRHLEMLRRNDVLEAVAVLFPTTTRSWCGVPVVSLSDPPGVVGTLRWLLRGALRRLGHGVAALQRRPIQGLQKVLSAHQIDTVLCQYATTAVALRPVLETSSCGLFIHLHGTDTYENTCPRGHRESVLELSGRSILICNSEVTRGRMLDWGITADRLVVKYPGVEVPASPPVRRGGDGIRILHLGRLIPLKGAIETLRAFEMACERGLAGTLVVAGDGPLRSECERLRDASQWRRRIKLLGEVPWDQGERLRAAADVFTQHNLTDPSTGQVESFGVSLVEAMASGLPVVGTSSGGVVEIVKHGETGALIEPGDVAAQAEWFDRLERDSDLRTTMGGAGWRRAAECFSLDREEVALLEILRRDVPTVDA